MNNKWMQIPYYERCISNSNMILVGYIVVTYSKIAINTTLFRMNFTQLLYKFILKELTTLL